MSLLQRDLPKPPVKLWNDKKLQPAQNNLILVMLGESNMRFIN